jgi:hypothetical protein
MAFLVCFSSSLADHTLNKAIYLDQAFYELIYAHCRSERERYPLLGEIASLRYKSSTIIVGPDRLTSLPGELAMLSASGASHAQMAEFSQVCARAQSDGCSLTISGDMYPEL